MIPFFRRIRKQLADNNKPILYFRYAIGEIVLVVIGILIALGINNWNEERNEINRIKSYSNNLINDLEQDIVQTNIRIRQIEAEIKFIDNTSNYLRNKSFEDLNSNIDLLIEIYKKYGYRPFTWYNSTIEEIKNSGSLKSIKNDSLRKMIASYYAFTNHLDDDYENDNGIAKEINRALNNIINSNYPNREALFDSIDKYRDDSDNEKFRKTSFYKEIKENDLQMLATDINELRSYVNGLFDYRRGIETRKVGEFPRLIKNAQDIITLIKNELE